MNATAALNTRSDVPVWFLDIDGVINSYPAPKAHMIKKYGEYKLAIYGEYMLWYSPRVIDFINAVNASGLVEVVWLTTWKDEAPREFAPRVGLDHFPTITDDSGADHSWGTDWWKWRRVRDFLGDNEGNRRVVWTDDDLSRRIKEAFWYRYDPEKTNSLLLTPMSNPGLTPDHLDSILEFLKREAN